MRGRVLTVFMTTALLLGAGLLAYPTLSNLWNVRVQTRAVASYDEQAEALSAKKRDDIQSRAKAYNEALRKLGSDTALIHPEKLEAYSEMLDFTGSGIMGYVTIEKIHVKLPIYHGTASNVLSAGAGHLEGSSLPIGGKGSHSVISAHRGLPSAQLFTRLSELEEGDYFTLTVLDENLTYQVDQIKVVLPTEFESLYIEEGKDLCTLMTCTPYGINTHRLLVRGVRTELPAFVPPGPRRTLIGPVAAIFVLTALIAAALLYRHRKNRVIFVGAGSGSRYPDNVRRRERKRKKSLNRRRRRRFKFDEEKR